MKLKKLKEFDLGNHPFIYLIPISDMHIGDPNFNEEKFFDYRKWVEETPEAYVILNGDIMNSTIKDSVGDIYHETMNPQDQLRYAKKNIRADQRPYPLCSGRKSRTPD